MDDLDDLAQAARAPSITPPRPTRSTPVNIKPTMLQRPKPQVARPARPSTATALLAGLGGALLTGLLGMAIGAVIGFAVCPAKEPSGIPQHATRAPGQPAHTIQDMFDDFDDFVDGVSWTAHGAVVVFYVVVGGLAGAFIGAIPGFVIVTVLTARGRRTSPQ
jgi:hypothetical protein